MNNLAFERDTMIAPALSPEHFRVLAQEDTIGPLTKIIRMLQDEPAKLAQLRGEYAMIGEIFEDNALHFHFFMTRGNKV